ncbi:lysozyme [Novosphingobium meiothermophilum]|uniref:lysozyme n=1 Tax=Novosphingobium meiothermophilum TaxID=2202251 RepID=UPI000D6E1BAC|nr:lysozyme [Novosphingobium meiothermophilum]
MRATILPEAARLIKDSEGLRLRAYQDSVGVWTIGYGHTGPDVTPGLVISKQRAEELFALDVQRMAADVFRLVKKATDTQFSALVCFAFNVGPDIDEDTKAEGLGDSTLLKLHNAGKYAAAADEFRKWVFAGGKKLPGLVTRRERERALYLKPGKPLK